MEEAEFSRKWADLKSSEEEKKFLMAQFNKLLGPIDGFKRRLPNIPNGVLLISKDKFAKMAANSQNARVVQQPALERLPSIVEEMTSVPSLIDAMDPLIVQRFKMQPPPPPPPPPPRTKRPSDTKSPEETPTKVIKTEPVQKAPPKVPKSKETSLKASNHNAANAQSERPTPKPASNSIKPYINSNSARRGTSKERPPMEKMEPTTSADPSGGLDRSSQRRPNSTQGSRPSSVAQASTSASPAPKRKSSPTNAATRPSSRRSNESKRELVPCKMPQYALGEFCGYKAKIKGDKQNSRLPEMVVSLNIAKMNTLEEIMAHVKAIVTKPPRAAGEVKIADLNRALCCCGLMLYAVCQAPPDGVNDLLREVMAMLRVFRTTYFMDSPQCQKLTNFTPTSAFLYLADSFLCERLYENTMDAARIRRKFMEEHRSVFSNVGENEVLSTQNLTALLDMKDRATVKEMLKDVVVNDAVSVPKLQLQILLETSQHAMLHERHVYAKSLAEELMVGSQKELWHRLVKDMKIRLDATSGSEIADAIFTFIYWSSRGSAHI
ncbi:hypothetical protein M3Y99_00398300 [Aphelenchoides fujianensis]|nr:hypothetical protein M3Y99_00398300 [Aphelenchoides fujianensis]